MITKARNISLVLFSIMFAVTIAGCRKSPNPLQLTPTMAPVVTIQPTHIEPTKTSSPSDLEQLSQHWLQGIPCKAPCWEGIMPGQTTVSETVALLRDNPIIDPESFTVWRSLCELGGEETATSGGIMWDWIFAEPRQVGDFGIERAGGDIAYGQQIPCKWSVMETVTSNLKIMSRTVTEIVLDFPDSKSSTDGRTYKPSLGKVIEAYGDPNYIVAIKASENDWYYLNIIYELQGFVLTTGPHSNIVLNGELSFEKLTFSTKPISDGLVYFIPEGTFTIPELKALNEKCLTPWQGMKDFDFYCRLESGEPCQ